MSSSGNGLRAAANNAESSMSGAAVGGSTGVCPVAGGFIQQIIDFFRNLFNPGGGGSKGGGTTPPPVPPPIGPVIQLAQPLAMVRKSYIPPANAVRTQVVLTVTEPGAFDGSGQFTVTSPSGVLDFFDAATDGNVVTRNGTSFSAAALNAGVTLFAEGVSPSAAMDDIQLTLALTPGSRPVHPPAQATMTSVEVTLDICQSRTAAGADPTPLSTNDKINTGRNIHVQDTGANGFHHGRAMLIVHKAVPDVFPGTLELHTFDGRVRVFDTANEVAAAGQAALGLPHQMPNGAIPATGTRLWAEAASVSGALRDTGFRLGIAGLGPDGDWARVTAVEFSNLAASVPATPPNRARAGNAPAVHNFQPRAAPATFDEDFATNVPLVLIENSLPAGKPVDLSVQIAPAGVPVFWSVQRAIQAGGTDPLDHADIVAMSAGAAPNVSPLATDSLTARLMADNVGSFHVRAYVDCNGTGDFERNDGAGARIDREPFILLNLVLVRVTLNRNNSVARSGNFTGAADGAGGIGVSSGTFNVAAPATTAMHMNATIDVVGGGADGRTGLNRVFAGWINNETRNEDIVGTFNDASVAPAATRRTPSVFAINRGAATGAHVSGSPAFIPGNPAPQLRPPPLLDSGRNPAGVGGETATLTRSRIRSRSNQAVGQRWIVEAVDSPGDSEGANHPGFAAAQLQRFRFRLFFRAALCIWTGSQANSGRAANRLYSVVLDIDWRMRAEWTISAAGVVAVATNPRVSVAGTATTSPAVPVEGTGIEVRFPTGLNHLARDCRA